VQSNTLPLLARSVFIPNLFPSSAERQAYSYLVHCNTLQSVIDVLTTMKEHGIALAGPRAQVIGKHLSFP